TTMPRRRTARVQDRAKSPASPPPVADKVQPKWQRRRPQAHRPWTLAVVGGLALIAGAVLLAIRTAHSPGQLQNRAEAAARAGEWVTALADWRAVNATASASSASHLSEARACLALGRASQAERSLQRAIGADPSDLTPWQILLRILRIEDRTREAEQLGWKAF